MQIFGQNIYGLYITPTQEGVYTGELEVLLRRLINAQFSVTSDSRLSESSLSLLIVGDSEHQAAFTIPKTISTTSTISTSYAGDGKHEASIFIE